MSKVMNGKRKGLFYTDIGHDSKHYTLWFWEPGLPGIKTHTSRKSTDKQDGPMHVDKFQVKGEWENVIQGRTDHKTRDISIYIEDAVNSRQAERIQNIIMKKWPNYNVYVFGNGAYKLT